VTTTIVRFLLPVVEYRATYWVAKGRPWSPLEWLILQGAAAGAKTVADIELIFGVHSRLLIEALVTLTSEGWLAVSSDRSDEFVLTPVGRRAAFRDTPPKTHIREPKAQNVGILREQVTGGLYAARAMPTHSQAELDRDPEWAGAERLLVDDIIEGTAPEAAELTRFLYLPKNGWIDSAVTVGLPSSSRWVKLTVDTGTGTLAGGNNLTADLRISILASVGITSRTGSQRLGDSTSLRASTPDSSAGDRIAARPVELRQSDLLSSEDEHTAYLRAAIAQANTFVLIASAFVTAKALAGIRDVVLDAVDRGVRVELLGGYSFFDESLILYLNTWRTDASRLLHLNRERPSGSHAKLLVFDRADDSCELCLGSFNWLSADPTERSGHIGSNVSMVIRHPAVAADVARYTASLWEGAGGTGGGPERWEAYAKAQAAVGAMTSQSAANAEVRLVFDREHDSLFRSWIASANDRFAVASHKMGNPTASRFFPGLYRQTKIPICRVLFGELLQPELEEVSRNVDSTLAEMGALQSHLPWLHSKLLIADNRACVSSYNFLSAGASTAKVHREIGLVISPVTQSGRGQAAPDDDDLGVEVTEAESDDSESAAIDDNYPTNQATVFEQSAGADTVQIAATESSEVDVAGLHHCPPVDWLWKVVEQIR
jgi:hypothetical protein